MSARREREEPVFARDVRTGQSFSHKNITIEIVEVIKTRDILNRTQYIIAYRIRDGNFVSPVAHWFLSETDDVKKWIKETIDFYLKVKNSILQR